MSGDARRGYTMLARLFLIVGGVFALLAVVQIAGGFRLFNGNPLGVALIVLVIGVLLEWTVRTAPPPSAAPEDSADEERSEEEPALGEPGAEEAAAYGAARGGPGTDGAPDDEDRARTDAGPGPLNRR
jgi:hypothetical protein